MNPGSPVVRFMAAIVGVAVGLRLVYELLQPIVPALAVVAVLGSFAYIAWRINRRRDRW